MRCTMRTIPRPAIRWAALLASLPLVFAAAVGVQAHSDAAGAPSMAVEVSGLVSGDVVTGSALDLTVTPIGF